MALDDLRRALSASWEAATHHDVTPTPAVLAGGALKAAGGNPARAREKLAAAMQYLADLEREERERARRAG